MPALHVHEIEYNFFQILKPKLLKLLIRIAIKVTFVWGGGK